MGVLFVPLSTATLRSLPALEVAKGAGLYNLFRQLGGSFGIAALATLLDHRADVHRTALSAQVGPLDPVASQSLATMVRGLVAAGAGSRDGAANRDLAARDARSTPRPRWRRSATPTSSSRVLFVVLLPLVFLIARHAPGKYAAIE